ncbi:sugar phosphate isomerase/epimerase [Fodinisporobacter ferrooxydans]|uniref:Sugar phosphate isomerase/epimerase n=1 Tax=Fodinisporobacter ferrooxydans TaxID=2901836 RepID=A0ABY4CKX2_9BACL|nr:sugar phosphate isomerase/epimerase [Alicyclobacillaceae bacterium MYW30-H2]
MTRQFSLAHLTVLGCTPPEMTYIAARTGYDFVSFRPIDLGTPNEPKYPLAEDKVMMRQTKAALAETGVKLLDIELARIYDGVDPKIYLPAMEVAAELGGRHILTSAWTEDRNFVIDCFSELCDLAKPFGLTVDFEFVTWASVTTLKEAVDIVSAANRENAGIMVDTLHFNRSHVRLEELDSVPREWFHFAHVCDAPKEIPTTREGLLHTGRAERLYVGEGGIDIAAILNRMPEIPYSLELPHVKRVQELGYEEFARRCLQTAKDYLDTHSSPCNR